MPPKPGKKRKHSVSVDTPEQAEKLAAKCLVIDRDDDFSERKKTADDGWANLVAGLECIDSHPRMTPAKKRKATRPLDKAKLSLQKILAELDAEEITKQYEAAAAINRAKSSRTDGCVITFINIGMGDCTIITTPEGRRIMIDCGSAAMSDVKKKSPTNFIRDAIRGENFLDGYKVIDILFLTHPDKDHYNKLRIILKQLKVTITFIYYGGTEKFAEYCVSGVSEFLQEICGDTLTNLKCVVHAEADKLDHDDKVVLIRRINKNDLDEDRQGEEDELGEEHIDPDTKAIVIYYEEHFKISVLAANVTGVWEENEDTDEMEFLTDNVAVMLNEDDAIHSTGKNLRSLMVLIETYDQKILVCGDALGITEKFVINHFSELLSEVDIVRIGHHGSPTSSSSEFVQSLSNLQTAVASTGGPKTRQHLLPQESVLQKYLWSVKKDDCDEHTLYVFAKDAKKAHPLPQFKDITKSLWATGSTGDYSFAVNSTTTTFRSILLK